ncbi:hypothetical protein DICPUDRAFT_9980, partial [Dictyostelium purpureum]
IISVVGIRELDIYSDQTNLYYFTEWEYNYFSTIQKENKVVSNITVILEWYNIESTLNFANEIITINPSTIKYTIMISKYPFTSKLNSLQLVMKAMVESSDTSSCSGQQFGNLEIENSDYLKLQIGNYSLKGRFIKKCIIDDGIIQTLSNTLLNSDDIKEMDIYQTKQDHQYLQSFIGINIGQFSNNVVVDPDFSVLVDSYKPSCNNNSNLSKTQIAGIVVGSVVLFIIIIISLALLV